MSFPNNNRKGVMRADVSPVAGLDEHFLTDVNLEGVHSVAGVHPQYEAP